MCRGRSNRRGATDPGRAYVRASIILPVKNRMGAPSVKGRQRILDKVLMVLLLKPRPELVPRNGGVALARLLSKDMPRVIGRSMAPTLRRVRYRCEPRVSPHPYGHRSRRRLSGFTKYAANTDL
jgi:hypothetical protein